MNKDTFDRYVDKFNNTPTTKNARKSFQAMRSEVERLQKENDNLKFTLSIAKGQLDEYSVEIEQLEEEKEKIKHAIIENCELRKEIERLKNPQIWTIEDSI